MITVKRLLQAKGSHAATVKPDACIADVISALDAEEVGALVVSCDGKRVDGIISQRDVIRGLRSSGPDALQSTVRELMSSDVYTCSPGERIVSVMALMDSRLIRHVPVVDDGEIVGMVTMRDIVRLRLDEVQDEADAMRSHIMQVDRRNRSRGRLLS